MRGQKPPPFAAFVAALRSVMRAIPLESLEIEEGLIEVDDARVVAHIVAEQFPGGVAVFPFAADPAQPRPSPHRPIVRPPEAVHAAGDFQATCHRFRRAICLSNYANHEIPASCGCRTLRF
jgi:hypothetical protein